jgi:hypothetical protein
MIVVKSPSVWMIHLNSTQNYPAEWINLATVEQIIYLENEQTIHIRFSSGKIDTYHGDAAQMLLSKLAKCPGLVS